MYLFSLAQTLRISPGLLDDKIAHGKTMTKAVRKCNQPYGGPIDRPLHLLSNVACRQASKLQGFDASHVHRRQRSFVLNRRIEAMARNLELRVGYLNFEPLLSVTANTSKQKFFTLACSYKYARHCKCIHRDGTSPMWGE